MELNAEDQKSLLEWKSHRETLAHRLMKAELDAKLEESGLDYVASTPFLRVLVRSTTNSGQCEEAMLTIWRPTEGQLDLIKDESILTLRNVGVKSERRDGLLQLATNSGTSISEQCNGCQKLPTSKVVEQSGLVSILTAHKLSRLLDDTSGQSNKRAEIDISGVVLNFETVNSTCCTFYVTDRSGKALRVESHTHNPEIRLQLATLFQLGDGNELVVCAFRRLTLKRFDDLERCPVAEFSEDSRVLANHDSSTKSGLMDWAASEDGRRRIALLRHSLKVSLHPADAWTSSVGQGQRRDAVGFIAGLSVSPNQHLLVDVDCGHGHLQTWRFPLSCVQDIMASCGDSNDTVVLSADDECNLNHLTKLESLFRARSKMYRFSLEPSSVEENPPCELDVVHVAEVDTEAMASFLAQTLVH